MKLFLVTLFVGIAAAAKLQNGYIPPSSAGSAGGQGSFLQGPSAQYLPPKQSFNNAGQPSAFSHGSGGGGGGAFGGQSQGAYGGHGGSAGGFGGQGGSFGGQGGGSFGGHQSQSGPQIPILRYENVNNGDGSYHFDYATGNGITQNEEGHLNNPGSDYAEQAVSGSYSYTGDDGQTYTVHYKADSNGFQATGDHLPTPPPIPEAIQKSLEYNAAHPEENDAGQYNAGAHGGQSYGGSQGSSGFGGAASHGGSGFGGAASHGGSGFGGAASHGGSGFGGAGSRGGSGGFSGGAASHGGSAGFGGRPQQQYLPPNQGGQQGGASGYHY